MKASSRVYVPPNDEQLANFVCVTALGPGFTEADREVAKGLLAIRFVRMEWLYQHRKMQETAWKLDDEAERTS